MAEFRLDDDDAVAVDFVEQKREDFEEICRLLGAAGWRAGLGPSSREFAMAAGDDGIEATPVLAPWWSAGHGGPFLRTGAPRTVIDFSPITRIWHQMPGLSLQGGADVPARFSSANDSSAESSAHHAGPMEPKRRFSMGFFAERFRRLILQPSKAPGRPISPLGARRARMAGLRVAVHPLLTTPATPHHTARTRSAGGAPCFRISELLRSRSVPGARSSEYSNRVAPATGALASFRAWRTRPFCAAK